VARRRRSSLALSGQQAQREVADPGRGPRDGRRRRVETARAEDRQARRRVPAGKLGVQDAPVMGPNAQAVLAPQGAGRRQHGVAREDDAALKTFQLQRTRIAGCE
jgi:hypothetical protein